MKTFRGLALAAAVLALGIAVLGSWVRINGAGMTCPDWPLCRGVLVPELRGGVVLEWTHRLLVFLESFVLAGVIVAGLRIRRELPGVTLGLAALGAAFVAQVAVGGITIFQANSPPSVALHWGTGMLFLAALVALVALAFTPPATARGPHAGGALVALSIATVAAFATMCVGAYVSSSGAGLACPVFPACGASSSGGAQAVQMAHRGLAFVTVFAALAAGFTMTAASARTRLAYGVGAALVALQFGLGVANVFLQLPIALREAHAANAALVFVVFTLAATFAALDPHAQRELARDRAPARQVPADA